MGWIFVSNVVAGLLLGVGADWLFGSSPWGAVTGIVLGSVAAYWSLYRVVRRIDAVEKAARRPGPSDDDERDLGGKESR